MRKFAAVPIVLAALGVAAPGASAGIGERLDAADQVERSLEHRDRSFSYVASCRQLSRTRFTCSWSGFKSHALANGRASVRRVSRYGYRARISSFHRTSY